MNAAKQIEVGSSVTNSKPLGTWTTRNRKQVLHILAEAFTLTGTVESIKGNAAMVRMSDGNLKLWNLAKLQAV